MASNSNTSLYDKAIHVIKNNIVIVIILLAILIIGGLASTIEDLDKSYTILKKWFAPQVADTTLTKPIEPIDTTIKEVQETPKYKPQQEQEPAIQEEEKPATAEMIDCKIVYPTDMVKARLVISPTPTIIAQGITNSIVALEKGKIYQIELSNSTQKIEDEVVGGTELKTLSGTQ
jgi:hypothetical protein